MEIVVETERLILRKFTLQDAPFVLNLVNTPTWLRFIGDRNVHSIEDAERYLLNGSLKSYQEHGFGFYAVLTKESFQPVGMCGLVKRDSLKDVDIGFAFLPDSAGKGYGFEAATATMSLAKNTLKLKRIIAIVDPENEISIGLIKKIGLTYERMLQLSPDDIELMLWGKSLMG